VVGDDGVDRAVEQALPEQVPVGRLADRRAALVRGGAVGHLLGGEDQVVRAGLGGDPHAVAAGAGEHGQRVGRRHVQDVRGGGGPAGALDHPGDREVSAPRGREARKAA